MISELLPTSLATSPENSSASTDGVLENFLFLLSVERAPSAGGASTGLWELKSRSIKKNENQQSIRNLSYNFVTNYQKYFEIKKVNIKKEHNAKRQTID